eukprot:3234221-Pleurochrysis_carterae.AAC.1
MTEALQSGGSRWSEESVRGKSEAIVGIEIERRRWAARQSQSGPKVSRQCRSVSAKCTRATGS